MNKLFTEFENIHGIYQIINLIDGKMYIGSASNLNKRLIYHKSNLKNKRHVNTYLQNAFNKYGIENFDFKILEIVSDKKQLRTKEQFYIDNLKCVVPLGYNLFPTAGSPLGSKLSDEHKLKLSKALKGRTFSLETRKRLSEWQIGRKMSDKAKENMFKAKLGNQCRRDKSKWPCPDGQRCKCDECKIKRRINKKNWENTRKLIIEKVEFLNVKFD